MKKLRHRGVKLLAQSNAELSEAARLQPGVLAPASVTVTF